MKLLWTFTWLCQIFLSFLLKFDFLEFDYETASCLFAKYNRYKSETYKFDLGVLDSYV